MQNPDTTAALESKKSTGIGVAYGCTVSCWPQTDSIFVRASPSCFARFQGGPRRSIGQIWLYQNVASAGNSRKLALGSWSYSCFSKGRGRPESNTMIFHSNHLSGGRVDWGLCDPRPRVAWKPALFVDFLLLASLSERVFTILAMQKSIIYNFVYPFHYLC